MTPKTISAPSREVPVLGEYDVVVCGGGPAGCAAAIGAARHGAGVLLVEKDGYLGGATVSQLVVVVLSMNGVDFQGIWHEYARRLFARGAMRPLRFQNLPQYDSTVDPEAVKFVWDEMLTEAGVRLLHHAHLSGCLVENGVATTVIVETKAGSGAIRAQRIIDATGDGIVCHYAGVPWEQGDGTNKYAMACTKVFRMGGVKRPEPRISEEQLAAAADRLGAAIERGEFDSPILTEKNRWKNYARHWGWGLPDSRPELMCVLSRVLKVDPLDPWDFTRAEREGREQARQAAEAYRRFMPGFENAYFLDTSAHLGVRSSRRVRGLATVTAEDAVTLHTYPDSIARGSFSVDVWPADSYSKAAGCVGGADAFERFGVTREERNARLAAGHSYGIRYGALVAAGVDNLLMAGRCLSAEHHAESSLRIQQTCMSTGEAAGVAAALSLRHGTTPRALDPKRVLAQLGKDRDVKLAFENLNRIPPASTNE